MQIHPQQFRGVEGRVLPADGPVEMRASDAACGAAESEAVAGGNVLSLVHIDAAEVH